MDGGGASARARPTSRVPCPLCRSRLQPGERIHSLIYPGGEQRLVHILGCPRCYPSNAKARRVCPICRKELPADGFIIGRMWNSEGKQHLRITACTACKKRTLKV